MSLTKLTENLNNIGSLADKPSMESSALKQLFDKAGNDIKTYINQVLTEELDTLISGNYTTLNNLITSNTNRITQLENGTVYSTDEVRIGTYEDKALYRKLIKGFTDGNSTLVISLTNAKIENYYGRVKAKFGQWWNIPNTHSESQYNVEPFMTESRDEIRIALGSAFQVANLPYVITVEYTKNS